MLHWWKFALLPSSINLQKLDLVWTHIIDSFGYRGHTATSHDCWICCFHSTPLHTVAFPLHYTPSAICPCAPNTPTTCLKPCYLTRQKKRRGKTAFKIGIDKVLGWVLPQSLSMQKQKWRKWISTNSKEKQADRCIRQNHVVHAFFLSVWAVTQLWARQLPHQVFGSFSISRLDSASVPPCSTSTNVTII